MSRTTDKAHSKAAWRRGRKDERTGRPAPYGKKAVRNYKEKSNGTV